MIDTVMEWVEKAEEDYRVAIALRRLRHETPHNAICFHAQQCIEKYLKAILERDQAVIRKIHALPTLLDQCVERHPMMAPMRDDMVRLSVFAVEFRYPGESANSDDTKTATAIMKSTRDELRSILHLV